jgi:hypothetical protein
MTPMLDTVIFIAMREYVLGIIIFSLDVFTLINLLCVEREALCSMDNMVCVTYIDVISQNMWHDNLDEENRTNTQYKLKLFQR